MHVAKIQWVVNKVLGKNFFKSDFVEKYDKMMQKHPDMPVRQLLEDNEYGKVDKL